MACTERNIGFLLSRAARTFSHALEQKLEKEGIPISHEQFSLLMELFKGDAISQQELADRVNRGKTSVTRLLNGLEKKGYVLRCDSPEDKRKRLVCLTPEGNTIQEELRQAARHTEQIAIDSLEGEDLESIKNHLDTIYTNLWESNEQEDGLHSN